MRLVRSVRVLLVALSLSLVPTLPLAGQTGTRSGQTGTLTGTVTDAETGAPMADVAIEVLGLDETQAGGVYSNAQGQFQVTLDPGAYSLLFTYVGYRTQRMDGVRVGEGENRSITVELKSNAFLLDPVVVTASRRAEKALEAPAHVEQIGAEVVEERAAMTPIEHVKGLPGVDIAQTGITQSNVVTRGFNNVFSGALLIMTDNRYTHVPSLRFNANNMIAANDLDIDRIEVSLGPGAALYGPNSANGVLHIITKSPIDYPGGTAYITSGVRSGNNVNSNSGGVFQSGFRFAQLINERTGIKVSGQYSKANDWEYIDPLERLGYSGGKRDFTSERYGGEIRLDHRLSSETEVVLDAGYNVLARSIELTGLGAGQAKDWGYGYVQGRFRSGRLFTQAFLNQSDAGETYLFQTGMPVVDNSQMMAFQLQHGLDLGGAESLTYGLDLQRTVPRTKGTITGSNENDDTIDEVGGYLHSVTGLRDNLDLVAALRIDHNSRLQGLIYSPRVALSFTPVSTPEVTQNFRLTFNRAFSTPTTNNLFLDIVAGRVDFAQLAPAPVAPLFNGFAYDVRTFGVPSSGLSFDDRCEGAYCMYHGLFPGTGLPSDGPGPFWNLILQRLAAADPSMASILPFIQSDDPAIATYFRRFNQEALDFLPDAEGPTAIERLKPTITNTFEAGYGGTMGGRLSLAADVYYSKVNDFVGPLRTETPTVFMDPQSIGAYLTEHLTPLVQAGALTPAQLQATVTGLATNLAQFPLGTIAPDQRRNSATPQDLVLTYRNFGDVNFWGADLSAQVIAGDRLSFRASGSYVSEECFDFNNDKNCSSSSDIALNAPSKKGAFSARWSDPAAGVTLEGQVRYSDAFPMNSGVYIGDVAQYTVLDATVDYSLPMVSGATLTLTATNLLNNLHQEFVGAPELGRLLLLRVQYGF